MPKPKKDIYSGANRRISANRFDDSNRLAVIRIDGRLIGSALAVGLFLEWPV
jgi:hypothetical protein